jgi:hypothetical protein
MVKKVAAVLSFFLIVACIAWISIPNKESKKNEISGAMSSLGNFAETHDKTDNNIKEFNEIFHEGEVKKNQP